MIIIFILVNITNIIIIFHAVVLCDFYFDDMHYGAARSFTAVVCSHMLAHELTTYEWRLGDIRQQKKFYRIKFTVIGSDLKVILLACFAVINWETRLATALFSSSSVG